jgi:hypothetical protein
VVCGIRGFHPLRYRGTELGRPHLCEDGSRADDCNRIDFARRHRLRCDDLLRSSAGPISRRSRTTCYTTSSPTRSPSGSRSTTR